MSEFRCHNDFNADLWAIRWVVKNYGTLPASDVNVEVVLDRDGHGDFGGGPVCRGWEMLPQAQLEGFVQIRVDRDARDQLTHGETPMVGHVKVTYLSPGASRFTHSADFAFDRTTQNFKPNRPETRSCDG